MAKNYNLYHEDASAFYFETGRVTGGFFKTLERIAVCKLCGMEYSPFQRHGPVDLEECIPRDAGYSKEGGVCTECGLRAAPTLQFIYHDLEYVDICQDCIREHHGLDWFTLKLEVFRQVLAKWRKPS